MSHRGEKKDSAEQAFENQQRKSDLQGKRRALTALYGSNIHQNRKTMMSKI